MNNHHSQPSSLWLSLFFVLSIAGCTTLGPAKPANNTPQENKNSQPSRGHTLAQQLLIVDTHIDVPYRLFRKPEDISVATASGQFDYPRAKLGGLNAPFMSVYIPAAVDEAGEAFSFANQTIDSLETLATNFSDKFAIATCTQDVYQQFERALISLPMGMENGGPIDNKIKNLEHFYERGIRYITLTHSKSNHIGDSSYDSNEHWQGLSDFGKNLVSEMNRVGVMIDVSHVSDKAFWQVLELSNTPVIASHSSLRHFTPGFHRNMSDKMVVALAEAGGVIQINYGSSFLTKAARDYSNARSAAVKAHRLANHLPDRDPSLLTFMQQYTAANPYPFATLEDVLDHIDRTVDLAGIDAVGIGSDYDGVGDTLPIDLKDVASFPNLVDGLLQRGYSETAIEKILSGNVMRVWRAIEDYAATQGTKVLCRTQP